MERPKATDNEVAWSKYLAKQWSGVAEYRTPDGSRVDILTDEYAIEVEWIKKHYQAIGQSIFYAAATNRKPAIILLTRGKIMSERVYFLRCLVACRAAGIELFTYNTVEKNGA